jgi:signal transduction histidine kinase
MKRFTIVTLALVIGLCLTGNAFADLEVDKKECITKCEAVAAMVKEKGLDAAVAEVSKKDGQFVSAVTYTFLQKMDGTMIAHPMKASLIGKNLIDLKDSTGKEFFKEMIEVAKGGSGWVDYMWPKPGEEKPSEKTSYVLKIDDNVFVGAGVYK